MGAAAIPLIGAGVSAGSSLLGAGKAAKAQQQDQTAANGYYNAQTQAIQQLLGNYFQYAPTLENDLLNFSSQQQPEIQQLSNTLGLGNQSLLQSLRSSVGGSANPGAVLGNLGRDLMQNQGVTTQNMESQLVGQQLQAYGSLGDLISAPVGQSLSGLNNLGNTMSSAAAAYGNPWATAIGSIGSSLSNYSSPTPSPSPTPTTPTTPSAFGLTSGSPYNSNSYGSGNYYVPGGAGPGTTANEYGG